MFGVNRKVVFFEKPASMREQCAQVGKNLWLAGIGFLADEQGNLLPVTELKHRMGQLHDAFGFVLIDVPGASVCEDADIFGQIAGAAILVVEANSTRKVTARKAKVALEDAGVRVLGSVLHNRTFPIPEKLYRRL
jgi:Mrp family chromosome partitioning ATPase